MQTGDTEDHAAVVGYLDSYRDEVHRGIILGHPKALLVDQSIVVMPAYCWAERVLQQENISSEDHQEIVDIFNIFGPQTRGTDTPQHICDIYVFNNKS